VLNEIYSHNVAYGLFIVRLNINIYFSLTYGLHLRPLEYWMGNSHYYVVYRYLLFYKYNIYLFNYIQSEFISIVIYDFQNSNLWVYTTKGYHTMQK
jgi:hypothetical protein